MEIRESYLAMIRNMSGGWGAMCGALCMTRDALENRIYERKGQGILSDTAMAMQKLSCTTLYAEAVCTASGGTFVKLPDPINGDHDVLMLKFNELYKELGTYSSDFLAATKDDVIDKAERKLLEADVARVHKVLAELQAIMISVYCPNRGKHEQDGAQ